MCDDDDFIRYHFGEMPPAEREAFEERLATDDEAAARYQELQACFNDAEAAAPDDRDEAAPTSLADRTCERLSAAAGSPAFRALGRPRGGRLVDWAFGSLAVLLVALAAIPAALASREAARRSACANNLREIGAALVAYSDGSRGFFPVIGPRGHAGMFAVQLADGGYIDRGVLEQCLICPSSPLADRIAEDRVRVIVPTMDELRIAHAHVFEPMRRVMGGSYAYRLGYVHAGTYTPVRNRRDCRAALMADAPNEAGATARNHGGCSQNVLFQDGRVRFTSGCWSADGTDHLFLNSLGEVAAGRTSRDTVLAPSWAGPGPIDAVFEVGLDR